MDDEATCEKDFCIEKAKTGRAACKRCKQKCDTGMLRIAKLVPNYFSDGGGKLKHWFHVDCLFESFKTQKATSKRIESVDDLEGWDTLQESDKDLVLEKFEGSLTVSPKKAKGTEITKIIQPKTTTSTSSTNKFCDDNLFETFRSICDKIANVSSYTQKSKILQTFLIKGTKGKKFEGDLYLWFKLLLPSAVKRVYNLQSKQLIKVFSRIFRTDHSEMLIDLEQGDVSETIRKYFNLSKAIRPKLDSKLTVHDVDKFLDKLTGITREDDQINCFQKLCETCNADDVKIVIRLIKHDLRMNAGPRHILDALIPLAYSSFQSSRDLESVVSRFAPLIAQNKISSTEGGSGGSKIKADSGSSITATSGGGVQLMCPISPMLAEACKSVEKAVTKNPLGMYSEIKYDGERVQIHKRGSEFKFFTRNLKPVMDHKIRRCKEFIPKAFPSGKDLILDSEIIVVNTKTGELLPFGTLGVHKREQFESAEVCLFVFDCIYYNGEDLTKRTLKERKKVLEDNMKPIKNHVQMSEHYLLKTKSELASMTAKVLKAGLEGLVLKSIGGTYEPGKRGWLKIKKDYLFQGQMADTADLVVLGAWFGTGKKGGLLSVFLMGCFDVRSKLWRTVTKVHSGLDDNEIDELQNVFKPLMERAVAEKPQKWLSCKKQLMPDYIAIDPTKMPVWEITGAEFTKAEAHTANGISIRFPRITKMRHDKSTAEATNLDELELLFKNSKEHINVDMLFKDIDKPDAATTTTATTAVDIKTKLFDLNRSFDEAEENDDVDPASATDDDDDGSDGNRYDDDVNDNDEKKEEIVEGSINEITGTYSSNRKRRSDKDLEHRTPKKKKKGPPSSKMSPTTSASKRTVVEFESSPNDERKVKYKLNEVLRDDDDDNEDRIDDERKLSKKDCKELLANIKCDPTLIFADIKVYLKASVEKLFDERIRDEFMSVGGKIVENSRLATHVLHRGNENAEDFMLVRKKYAARCRHVSYKWICDCIQEGHLLPIGKYAVRL